MKINKKKYTGCLLGCAVGDALGMQTEGMTSAEIMHQLKYVFDYGPARAGSPNEKLTPGQYTDDTEQTLILTRTIIESGTFDPVRFSKKLADHCKKILSHPEMNRGWGSTSLTACKRLQAGTSWKESGGDASTCGSAMRASPIGLLYPAKPDELEEAAVLSSLPTHRNPQSIAGAVAVAVAVSLALKNTSPDIILQTSGDLVKKYDPALAKKIRSVEKIRHIIEINAFSVLGTSIRTEDVVPCALYCFSRNPLDFPKTVLTAVNAGGDTDSIAAIAGAISGAYLGIDAIPDKWLDGLEKCDEIRSLALDLWEISNNP